MLETFVRAIVHARWVATRGRILLAALIVPSFGILASLVAVLLTALAAGKLKVIVLNVAAIIPASRHRERSRKNCRFGWEEIGSLTTKYPTNGRRSTATTTKALEMMAPRITGGNVSMYGQTCAP